MPRLKARYSLAVRNNETGARLKVELVELPFAAQTRRFRVRVNSQWAPQTTPRQQDHRN
jgi:hypothetical protein